MHLGVEAAQLARMVRSIAAVLTLWDDYDYRFDALPMPIWRYCPNCYTLADSNSLLKRCPKCPTVANNHLQTLPLDPGAAQAAMRIGGTPALVQMIVALVGGDSAREALDRQDQHPHMGECDIRHTGVCDMGCEHRGSWGPIEDPEL